MSNSLDPDQARHYVRSDLGLNCKSYQQTALVGKELNALADVSSRAKGLNFGLSFHLHLYFVHSSSDALEVSLSIFVQT